MKTSFKALADRLKAFADSVGTSLFNITKWISLKMISLLNKQNLFSQISTDPLEVEYNDHREHDFFDYQVLKIHDGLKISGSIYRLFQFNCFGLKHNEKINFKVVYVTSDSDEENLEVMT